MYYEEKIINGLLYCRSTPDGEWSLATRAHSVAVNTLLELTDAQRMEVLNLFCCRCGTADPGCQCWNDE